MMKDPQFKAALGPGNEGAMAGAAMGAGLTKAGVKISPEQAEKIDRSMAEFSVQMNGRDSKSDLPKVDTSQLDKAAQKARPEHDHNNITPPSNIPSVIGSAPKTL